MLRQIKSQQACAACGLTCTTWSTCVTQWQAISILLLDGLVAGEVDLTGWQTAGVTSSHVLYHPRLMLLQP